MTGREALSTPVTVRLFLLTFLLMLAVSLSACGGGGGSNTGTTTNTTTNTNTITYTVTLNVGTGGSLSPSTAQTVTDGGTVSFTVTADAGYTIAAVSGCGGTLSGTTYTTGTISADCTVTASFTATAPPAATLVWSPTTAKQFHFSWTDVAGASEYRLLENPDGSSGYTQVATIAPGVGSYDLAEFLPSRINAAYILQACNTVGCTDSPAASVSGNLVQAIGYVKASNTGSGDSFGWSVALSSDGGTLAVGTGFEDSNATGIDGNQADDSMPNSGAVYIFIRSGATWVQQAYVKASNTAAGDYFGWSIALSTDGNTLAVSAYSEDSSATGINGNQTDNTASASGAVYVFTRSGSSWSQQAYIKASNTDAADLFGLSIALAADGNTLAVGADSEASAATGIDGTQTDNTASNSGAVYVFTRSGTTWTQQAYVKASNSEAGDYFGYSVALSGDGNTLAVGGYYESSAATGIDGNQADNTKVKSGAVYVFTRATSTWSQQAYVKASNTDANDHFGYSIALSGDGNTLAAGANAEQSAATGIDGTQSDNTLSSGSGAVYVFTRSAATWTQQAYIKASNTGAGDNFGESVSLAADGNTLAVGSGYEASSASGIAGTQSDNSASNSGAVYTYTRAGVTWTQQAYVKASNTGTGDYFGYAVALSADGGTLMVGALYESSAATGVGGVQADDSVSNSGAVYLY